MISFYNTQLEAATGRLKRQRLYRNLATVLKVLLFVVICRMLYGVVENLGAWEWWAAVVAAVALFVLVAWIDNRLVRRIDKLYRYAELCRLELDYLNGKLSGLDNGERYADPSHPYSHDLDLFGDESIFQRINRAVTRRGADMLAQWLSSPLADAQAVEQRLEATAELAARREWTLEFRSSAPKSKNMETQEHTLIESWHSQPPMIRHRVALYVANGVTIGLWVCAVAGLITYGWPMLMSILQLITVGLYFKRVGQAQSRLSHLVGTLSSYLGLVRTIGKAEPFESELLRDLNSQIFDEQHGNALVALTKLERIVGRFDQRLNIFAALVLNGLYMSDLHIIVALDGWRERYGKRLGEWVNTTSRFEALVSMAIFRANHDDYCVPKVRTQEAMFEGRGMGHPMIPRQTCVTNDLTVADLHNIYIVTGANMAGKSTFLRTVGVNLLLAMTGNVVSADRFECRPMRLFTAMRTTDNLVRGESYFHAELLRLQALVAAAEQPDEQPMFIILDEMLKGTNSHDKLNGSIRMLEKLVRLPLSGIVATHDLGLGSLAERDSNSFKMACFEIDHLEDQIVYDYTLRPGLSRNMNASILLEKMGLI